MNEDGIQALDSAIEQAPAATNAFEAFRLADSALMHAHAPRLVGCELEDLGFLDVTFDRDVAVGYLSGEHPVLIRIAVPAGTKAVPVFQTNDNNESDLLLARGTRFRVRSVELPDGTAPMQISLDIVA